MTIKFLKTWQNKRLGDLPRPISAVIKKNNSVIIKKIMREPGKPYNFMIVYKI